MTIGRAVGGFPGRPSVLLAGHARWGPPMTSEADSAALSVAFSAPQDRAPAGPDPRDRIALGDYVRSIEVGAFQAERGVAQRVRFDIVAEVIPDARAVEADDVDGILSYDTLIEAVDATLAAERFDLLETLAERIAARVLAHEQAARTFVRVQKLDRGPFVLGVEIVRARDRAASAQPGADEAPRPRIALLRAMPPGGIAPAIDAVVADGRPTILVVSPGFAPPRTENRLAQRRIDLLAVEQAAWQLAALDPRCVVRSSRTELDWALRRGELSVWAPSRMVLDATDGPDATDAETLARWLAGAFDAVELRVIGE